MTTLLDLAASVCRVTLETPDGSVWSGKVHVADILQQTMPFRGYDIGGQAHVVFPEMHWRMHLEGIGGLNAQIAKREDVMLAKELAAEWRCDWCGAVHPRETRQCTQCGGWRSVLYE